MVDSNASIDGCGPARSEVVACDAQVRKMGAAAASVGENPSWVSISGWIGEAGWGVTPNGIRDAAAQQRSSVGSMGASGWLTMPARCEWEAAGCAGGWETWQSVVALGPGFGNALLHSLPSQCTLNISAA